MENPQKPLSEIERLEIQIEQKKTLLTKKKKQLAEKEKKQSRANETRRKILAGAVVLQRAQLTPILPRCCSGCSAIICRKNATAPCSLKSNRRKKARLIKAGFFRRAGSCAVPVTAV